MNGEPFAAWQLKMLGVIAVLVLTACSLSTTQTAEPVVIYVTATPDSAQRPSPQAPPTPIISSPVPMNTGSFVALTVDPPRPNITTRTIDSHTVQPGDTLYGIAQAYGTSLDALLAVNALDDPNALTVGQVIQLPGIPTASTPSLKLIADGRFVRGPGSTAFDVAAFVARQPGYLARVTDEVDLRLADGSTVATTLSGAEIVQQVSVEYSIDPRLLLALLEYGAGWLSNPAPTPEQQERPFDVDREGFYLQLAWAANQLNYGYYGWKYRGWSVLELSGTERYLYALGLNAGTVAVQYFLSLQLEPSAWLEAVRDRDGFFRIYSYYFGDPFSSVADPVVPRDIAQPGLMLPFAQGEVWFYTGGWHGGWGSGSAWSAVDFAPPDERDDGLLCYTSAYFARAVAAGIIVRSDEGAVVLDLDGDGDESTGWTILYLHLAAQDRAAEGAVVQVGDPIGRPSCEGGFSTATHLHLARRYNGEWIPADCNILCSVDPPAFNLGGWEVIGIPGQEYQGFMERAGERLTAEQGRLTVVNRVTW